MFGIFGYNIYFITAGSLFIFLGYLEEHPYSKVEYGIQYEANNLFLFASLTRTQMTLDINPNEKEKDIANIMEWEMISK